MLGSILGLAIGDALGAPFEFRRRTQVAFPLPAFELSWMGLPPGTWTDDTAMAMDLWQSLIEHAGALDLEDVLQRHLAWLDLGSAGRRDPDEAGASGGRGRNARRLPRLCSNGGGQR